MLTRLLNRLSNWALDFAFRIGFYLLVMFTLITTIFILQALGLIPTVLRY